ncbi:unnamed protein product [Prunus armeniaca]|uniref:Wall-associated receptor kinase galacturonan-binding domain-containing protein n=1 Tax=Prunus armeniaca TaxID=36596 RepID=A0A6J5UCX9_PRUAR|nr:unnamed protein product [Prunus armeniaca]
MYSTAVPRMAKSGCQEYCGNVLIPYPFGIGSNNDCYLDDWFEIECSNNLSSKTTSSAPHYKPVLKRAQLEVLNISIGGLLRVNSPVTFFCNGNGSSEMANLTGSPFRLLSGQKQIHCCQLRLPCHDGIS